MRSCVQSIKSEFRNSRRELCQIALHVTFLEDLLESAALSAPPYKWCEKVLAGSVSDVWNRIRTHNWLTPPLSVKPPTECPPDVALLMKNSQSLNDVVRDQMARDVREFFPPLLALFRKLTGVSLAQAKKDPVLRNVVKMLKCRFGKFAHLLGYDFTNCAVDCEMKLNWRVIGSDPLVYKKLREIAKYLQPNFVFRPYEVARPPCENITSIKYHRASIFLHPIFDMRSVPADYNHYVNRTEEAADALYLEALKRNLTAAFHNATEAITGSQTSISAQRAQFIELVLWTVQGIFCFFVILNAGMMLYDHWAHRGPHGSVRTREVDIEDNTLADGMAYELTDIDPDLPLRGGSAVLVYEPKCGAEAETAKREIYGDSEASASEAPAPEDPASEPLLSEERSGEKCSRDREVSRTLL